MARDSSSRLQAATEAINATASISMTATPVETKLDDVTAKKDKKEPYEFSAPQYYDFAEPSPGPGQSDAWFGSPPSYNFYPY